MTSCISTVAVASGFTPLITAKHVFGCDSNRNAEGLKHTLLAAWTCSPQKGENIVLDLQDEMAHSIIQLYVFVLF